MPRRVVKALPESVDETLALLSAGDYVARRSLATALYLTFKLRRPLFLEGEAGVGKTEIAKVLSETLGRRLLRLQCYEGLDAASAVYEWNYALQMVEIRMAEAVGDRDRTALEGDLGVQVEKAVALIADIAGRVVVSGMGKSGHIGRKVAATMASVGAEA